MKSTPLFSICPPCIADLRGSQPRGLDANLKDRCQRGRAARERISNANQPLIGSLGLGSRSLDTGPDIKVRTKILSSRNAWRSGSEAACFPGWRSFVGFFFVPSCLPVRCLDWLPVCRFLVYRSTGVTGCQCVAVDCFWISLGHRVWPCQWRL